jgi:hypothetical protein
VSSPPIIQVDFLTPQECQLLIHIHSYYYAMHGKNHNDTEVLSIISEVSKAEGNNEPNFIKKLHAKISHHIQNIDKNAYINYFEIVKWKQGLNMGAHYDFDYHTYTSVIYLNEDYEGGETFVESMKIPPATGKIVTFEGNTLLHGVNKIIKGNRYTVPVWYKSI